MRRPDSYAVVGLTGIVLVAAAMLAFLSGAGSEARSNPLPLFQRLATRLGYRIGLIDEGSLPRLPAASLLLRCRTASDAAGKDGLPEADAELEAFVKAGGVVLTAGPGGLEASAGIAAYEGSASSPLLPSDLLGDGLQSGGAGTSASSSLPEASRYLKLREGAAAEVLLSQASGPYALRAGLGGGEILALADASLLSDARILDPEVAALVNALLSPYWERSIYIEAEVATGGASAFFKVLSRPRLGLLAFQLLLVAVLGAWAVSLRFGSPLPAGRREGRGAAAVAETFGGFYRAAGAYAGADSLLAAAFQRRLAALLGPLAKEGGTGGPERRPAGDHTAALARAASRRTGRPEAELLALLRASKPRGEAGLVQRELAREAILGAIAGAKGDR